MGNLCPPTLLSRKRASQMTQCLTSILAVALVSACPAIAQEAGAAKGRPARPDESSAVGVVREVIQLRAADPTTLAQALNAAFASGKSEASPLSVTAIPASHALIVSAERDVFEQVRRLIDRLDSERPAALVRAGSLAS